RLSPDALDMLHKWMAEIEPQLGEGGRMEMMADWGAKLAGATLRLAGIMHCVEYGPEGNIGVKTLAAAIEIARYLMPHASYTLSMMSATTATVDDDAQYLLRWINRHEAREFSRRDAHQHAKSRFPSPE